MISTTTNNVMKFTAFYSYSIWGIGSLILFCMLPEVLSYENYSFDFSFLLRQKTNWTTCCLNKEVGYTAASSF
ncbi:unnamed protein product, partial [Vitis vinifera]